MCPTKAPNSNKVYRSGRRSASARPLRSGSLVGFGLAFLGALATAESRGADPLPGQMPELRLPQRLQRVQERPTIGHWVEYSIYDRLRKRRLRLRMALVGKKGKRYWWEFTFRQARLPVLRLKMRVRGTITRVDRLERVILQTGNQRPLEIPLKKGQQMLDMYIKKRPGTKVVDRGKTTVKTAAGTFRARHFVWKDASGFRAQEWSSPKAGLWGLVRYRSKRLRMELIGKGKGARSRIRGVPAKWHIPGM
jgi:hypothetical protein